MTEPLRAGTLQLSFHEEAGVVLLERSYGQRWVWPLATLGVAAFRAHQSAKPVYDKGGANGVGFDSVPGWSVERVPSQNPQALSLSLRGPQGKLSQAWTLLENGLNVTTLVETWDDEQDDVRLVSPGLLSADGGASPALLAIYQGILHQGGHYADLIPPGSHGRHQLGVSGLLAKGGGMAAIVDLNWDYDLYLDAPANLTDTVGYVPRKSFGAYESSYTTYFRLSRSDVFELAQTYRDFKISKNEFKTWEEKREITPELDKMFGAPHLFLGYFQSRHETLASLERVASMGFDRAFVYPTVFRTYNPAAPIGDVPFINLEAIHEDIKKLGFHIAPWSWPEELIVDSTSPPALWGLLASGESGQVMPAWKVGDTQWYTVAGQAQAQFMRHAQAHLWPELTAQHFDVTGNKVVPHRFGGETFGVKEDATLRSNMLSHAATRGPVSTEGFCDGFIQSIHCGSVTAFPAWGDRDWWTVPLTSIIYHDSAMHVWWECDSYNNPHHQTQGRRDHHAVPAGGGKPLDQSLLDALQATPPNVFVCGRMYRPADGVHFASGSEYYDVTLEDRATQLALKLAKPVADLHRRVGAQQIVGYEMLTQDGSVQRTTFKDETVVTVNFGDTTWYDGVLELAGKTWLASR